MDKTQEMLVEIHELIISEAKRLKSEKLNPRPRPEELQALAALVHAANQVPRGLG